MQADLAFGREQVEQLVRDRPEIGPVIHSEPALREFLETSFAGFAAGYRVHWNAEEPIQGVAASCRPPGKRGDKELPALVFLTTKNTYSATDKCAMLVFELHNVRHVIRVAALRRMAQLRSISREDFVRSRLHDEFRALIQTRDYFREHYLRQGQFDKNPYYNGVVAMNDDFGEHLEWHKTLSVAEFNHLEAFRKEYDELAAGRPGLR